MLRVNAINRQGLLKCLTFNPKSLVFKTVSVPCHFYPNIHFVEFGTEERPGLFIVMGDDGLKEEANAGISLF